MRVYEAIAKAVVAEGAKVVFTVTDEFVVFLVNELLDKGVKVVHARHEEGAVAMADGYARATGGPGVCVIGAGPALAHTGTVLLTARKKRSPLLVIAADTQTGQRHDSKIFNQRGYVELTAGTFLPVQSAATVAEDVQLAFRHVRSGSGPAVLNAPADVLESEIDWDWQYEPAAARMAPPQRTPPDPELVARAAAILARAKQPVILAGRGAVASGAREEIEGLASRIGAVLITALQARGYFAGHPFDLGVAGGFATDVARDFLAQADCLVAVGASLNAYTTLLGFLFPGARVVHIDVDPARIGDFTPVELGIVGDAQLTVAALNNHLEKLGIGERPGFWSEEAKQRIKASRPIPVPLVEEEEAPGRVHILRAVAELEKLLPKDRIVVVDGGLFMLPVVDHISTPGPDSFVWTLDAGSLGIGLPIAVGTAVARPDRHCVVFVGDGGFMFSVQELETAVRHRIPITVVVLDDGTYGPEALFLEQRRKPATVALFNNPEFAEVARSFGATGVTVQTLADLKRVDGLIGKGDRPLLVHVKIQRQRRFRFSLLPGSVGSQPEIEYTNRYPWQKTSAHARPSEG